MLFRSALGLDVFDYERVCPSVLHQVVELDGVQRTVRSDALRWVTLVTDIGQGSALATPPAELLQREKACASDALALRLRFDHWMYSGFTRRFATTRLTNTTTFFRGCATKCATLSACQ